MSYPKISRSEVTSIFNLAGFKVISVKLLPDGYGYDIDDPRYFAEPPRCGWWFVKTEWGWFEVGWRKRVLSIEWSDTKLPFDFTDHSTTRGSNFVHVSDVPDALICLTRVRIALEAARGHNEDDKLGTL